VYVKFFGWLCLTTVVLFSAAAQADCIYNGTSYPTGTQIGGFVCSENGTWVPVKK
jgi:hypothetical protein